MEDILAAIEVIGSGRRSEVSRLYLRTKMGFIAPFGRVEPNIWNSNLSTTGVAVNCQTTLLSQELVDSIWTIELYFGSGYPQTYLSLVSQLVRISSSGWVAFQFVRLSDEDCAIIEALVERYATQACIEDPLDLTCLTEPFWLTEEK